MKKILNTIKERLTYLINNRVVLFKMCARYAADATQQRKG